MPALMPCTPPAAPPDGGVDATTLAPRPPHTEAADRARQPLPALEGMERLPPLKRSPGPRPGAVAPRQPLNTLSLARKATRSPAASMPHPDAAHPHAETHESPQTQSHALSAVLTVSHTLDLDVMESPLIYSFHAQTAVDGVREADIDHERFACNPFSDTAMTVHKRR